MTRVDEIAIVNLRRIRENLFGIGRYVRSDPDYVKAHITAAVGDLDGVIRRIEKSETETESDPEPELLVNLTPSDKTHRVKFAFREEDCEPIEKLRAQGRISEEQIRTILMEKLEESRKVETLQGTSSTHPHHTWVATNRAVIYCDPDTLNMNGKTVVLVEPGMAYEGEWTCLMEIGGGKCWLHESELRPVDSEPELTPAPSTAFPGNGPWIMEN